jgi:hypothetical protein
VLPLNGSTSLAKALYLRRKAEQCHRLAAEILNRRDPVILSLNALAIEFATQAAALEDHGQRDPAFELAQPEPWAALPWNE